MTSTNGPSPADFQNDQMHPHGSEKASGSGGGRSEQYQSESIGREPGQLARGLNPRRMPEPPPATVSPGMALSSAASEPRGSTRPGVPPDFSRMRGPATQGARPQGSAPPIQPTAKRGQRATVSTQGEENNGETQEEEAWLDRLLLGAPPWLISAIVHSVLLLILALLILPPLRRTTVELETVWAESLGEQLEVDTFLAGTGHELEQEPVLTPEDLLPVEDPFAAPPDVPVTAYAGTHATSLTEAPQIGLALAGREEGMKKALLAAYGGTATTEAAVMRGLQWLARQQARDGSWSLCGPYSNGVRPDWENKVAATAMALIAFQGAGMTHRRGQFRPHVERGWKWLLSQQDENGNFFSEGPFNHRFYTNGLCGIALCEIYGMTRDETFREPAERLIRYLVESQSPEGGWRYSPQADSDLSVTGWVLMALQSARMAGLNPPGDTFRKIERFLDRVALDGGARYSYQRGDEPTPAMTAEGLLCRQYLGWARNDPRLLQGVAYLTQPENLIDYQNPNVYYWYYATQVCHHMEGEAWRKWNERMRQAVPAHQVTSGPEAGSWDPMKPFPDTWAEHGGRLYVTCLSIYMLEVYYRHLPLYTNVFTLLGAEAQNPR